MRIILEGRPHIFIPGATPRNAVWTKRRGIAVYFKPTATGIHDPVHNPEGGAWIVCMSRRGGWMGRMRKVAQEIKASASFTDRVGEIAARRRGMWREGD